MEFWMCWDLSEYQWWLSWWVDHEIFRKQFRRFQEWLDMRGEVDTTIQHWGGTMSFSEVEDGEENYREEQGWGAEEEKFTLAYWVWGASATFTWRLHRLYDIQTWNLRSRSSLWVDFGCMNKERDWVSKCGRDWPSTVCKWQKKKKKKNLKNIVFKIMDKRRKLSQWNWRRNSLRVSGWKREIFQIQILSQSATS